MWGSIYGAVLGKIDGHYKKNDLPVLCREELLAVRVARDHLAPPL